MAVSYTEFLELGKPTVLDSLNVWGTELNEAWDKIDKSVLSNNFSQDSDNHSGLNFYYNNGRILNGTSLVEVSGTYITLTDNTTNYVEVDNSGTVSKNTTGFSDGSIPLYEILTSGGAISTITDKRAYFQSNYRGLFTLSGDVISSTKDFKFGTGTLKDWDTYNFMQVGGNSGIAYTGAEGTDSEFHMVNNAYYDSGWKYVSADEASRIYMEDGKIGIQSAATGAADGAITWLNCIIVDEYQNVNINNASKPTNMVGGINVKQGTDPTSAPSDQISIFATAGANATLGLRLEQSVVTETDETKFSHKVRVSINGTDYYIMLTTT